jgi:hypothetical protein
MCIRSQIQIRPLLVYLESSTTLETFSREKWVSLMQPKRSLGQNLESLTPLQFFWSPALKMWWPKPSLSRSKIRSIPCLGWLEIPIHRWPLRQYNSFSHSQKTFAKAYLQFTQFFPKNQTFRRTFMKNVNTSAVIFCDLRKCLFTIFSS